MFPLAHFRFVSSSAWFCGLVQISELYLPTKGIRFIAINDGVDSLVESSIDFNPIRNWANELHAKDTSKKVRAVKKM